jgi:bifunctional DNA-binding transcriptional regulator/antitoxin component of YhaV-PrlF toxin-antitoxin module
MSVTIQMRAKGTITLPSELRQKYALEDGDVFTLLDVGDGSFMLVPRISIVPKLVGEIEALRESAGLSVEDLLEGLPEERRKLFEERLRDGR